MIKIQVLGHGLIPRGQGIAPRKEPFYADLDTIKAILNAGGLKVNAINPLTGSVVPLNSANLMKMWNAFSKAPRNAAPSPKTPVLRPSTPASVTENKPNTPPINNIPVQKAPEVPKKPEEKRPEHQERKDNNVKPNGENKGNNNNGTLKVVSNPNEK